MLLFMDLAYGNMFQVYTSDLTSLITWTCPRCKGHTKVTRLWATRVCAALLLLFVLIVSTFSLASNCPFLFALLMQGFEVIEIIVDVENCLQVCYLLFLCKQSSFVCTLCLIKNDFLLKNVQAFVGVSPDPRSIIVAFRGTQEHRYRKCSIMHSIIIHQRLVPYGYVFSHHPSIHVF